MLAQMYSRQAGYTNKLYFLWRHPGDVKFFDDFIFWVLGIDMRAPFSSVHKDGHDLAQHEQVVEHDVTAKTLHTCKNPTVPAQTLPHAPAWNTSRMPDSTPSAAPGVLSPRRKSPSAPATADMCVMLILDNGKHARKAAPDKVQQGILHIIREPAARDTTICMPFLLLGVSRYNTGVQQVETRCHRTRWHFSLANPTQRLTVSVTTEASGLPEQTFHT